MTAKPLSVTLKVEILNYELDSYLYERTFEFENLRSQEEFLDKTKMTIEYELFNADSPPDERVVFFNLVLTPKIFPLCKFSMIDQDGKERL